MTVVPLPELSSDVLASELAARLNEVVPEGFSVRPERSALVILHGDQVVGTSDAAAIVESLAALNMPDRHVETATRAAIKRVQLAIVNASATPWPAAQGDPPLPSTRRTGNRVEAWFGSEREPVLQLEPLELHILGHPYY
jgi:hypothetical protein